MNNNQIISNINYRALIFTGGESPSTDIISWEKGLVLVADSGMHTCKRWNVIPDYIVGDFDSFSKTEARARYSDAQIIFLDTDKDISDTDATIQVAIDKGCKDVSIVGGMGGRIDHFLGVLSLFKSTSVVNRVVGNVYQLERISSKKEIDCRHIADKYISFFPLTTKTRQKTKGLKWELDDIVLSETQHSLSNEYLDTAVSITMQEGELLAVWAHGNKPQLLV